MVWCGESLQLRRDMMRINDLGSIFQKSDIAEKLETIFCMPFHDFPFVFSQFCRFPWNTVGDLQFPDVVEQRSMLDLNNSSSTTKMFRVDPLFGCSILPDSIVR